jgi:adenylate cyclase
MRVPAGLFKSRPVLACAVAFVVFTSVGLARWFGVLEVPELALYDRDLRVAATDEITEPPITLVLIGEEDIRRHGHPLRDETLRELIEIVIEARPRVLAIDLYRDLPVPPDPGPDATGESAAYRDLGATVVSDPRIIMIMKVADPDNDGTPPPQFLKSREQVGFADLPMDPDGVVRRGLLYLWEGETPILSVSMQVATRFLAIEGLRPAEDPTDPDSMRLGAASIPPLNGNDGPYVRADDAGYQFLLDYRFGNRSFRSLSLSQLLDRNFDAESLRDRIVIVGTAAQSVKDSFLTPIHGRTRGRTTYGVEVHAHAVDQLIRFARGVSDPLVVATWPVSYAAIVLFAVLGAGIGLFGRSLLLQATGLALVSAATLLAGRWFFSAGYWIPVFPPLFATWLAAAAAVALLSVLERVERRQIASLFSRFQGHAVADEIWRHRSEFMGEGDRPPARTVTLTALMSDLEGYTAASEEMEPEQLMSWINEYMSAMAELVEEHGGVVNDYAGDGVMANFGFPLPSESEEAISNDAERAIRCALAMGEMMIELNTSWAARGLKIGRCRVGICTGPAVVGCIGARGSLKYTSVGDTVNTAARLEGFDKQGFTEETPEVAFRVLVSEESWRRTQGLFEVQELGAHSLKGKRGAVEIYRVTGRRPAKARAARPDEAAD